MTVCVHGLWHLGAVTAACLADAGLATVGLAETADAAAALARGEPPLYEPGLAELMRAGLDSGRLSFTADAATAVGGAELVWVAFDTPVDEQDRADTGHVLDRVRAVFPHLRDGAVVLVSSQMPVGSVAALERDFAAVADGRRVSFACSPENLRLGQAIQVFTRSERIVIGVRDERARAVIEPVLSRFCGTLLWTRVESAEMVKHALNSFLATCITFTNEIASVCEAVGAAADEVEAALRLDPRIGPRAYVHAGGAFGGGTLARDVLFLDGIAAAHGLSLPVIGHVLASNGNHRLWPLRRLESRLGTLEGRRVAVLGLAYKPGTDAIRRSVAIDLCRALLEKGARLSAFDPKVTALPDDLAGRVALAPDAAAAAEGADALVLATEWPEFRDLPLEELARRMRRPLLLDQNAFLRGGGRTVPPGIEHVVVGQAS